MDLAAYEAYCQADPLFYDLPERVDDTGSRLSPAGLAQHPDRERHEQGVWTYLHQPGTPLPPQGWKIHISCLPDEAQDVLDTVSEYCFTERLHFKFLRSTKMLLLMNSKYSHRGSSGKFITVYPSDEQVLERTVDALNRLLAGRSGPYILSDLRCGDAPVFVRYGGFVEQYCPGPDGVNVLAIQDASGRLVPDERGPGFTVPAWVETPGFIRDCMADLAVRSRVDMPYRVDGALHFSNGGGVYKAEHTVTGEKVILKEARPHSGVTPDRTDAVTRLGREHEAMKRLGGLDCVPRLVEYAVHWEHHYLVQELIEGKPLQRAFVERFPLIRGADDDTKVVEYTEWALDVLRRVEQAVAAVHSRGLVFGDIHPNNIMIRPDGTVCLIDMEMAFDPETEGPQPMGAPGFRAPAGCSGFELDHYALAALRLWLFQPMVSLTALDPGKADLLADTITELFPVPTGYAHRAVGQLSALAAGRRPIRSERPHRRIWPIGREWSDDDYREARRLLAEGIRASATPERAERLFPGGIEMFREGAFTLAHGAAGVLYALAHGGDGPVDDVHVDWLVKATDRAPRPRPGFFDGLHGVAQVLDFLGRRDKALDVLDRALVGSHELTDPGLYGGLSGAGLNLLHFAGRTGDPSLVSEAVATAERILPRLTAGTEGESLRHAGPPGLMTGGSGVALFLTRLYEHTGDTAHLDAARAALGEDLARCRVDDDGALQVHDGWRLLPYLGSGSTGVGVAIGAYLAHRDDEELVRARTAVRRACEVTFTIQTGLFQGRAGVMAYAGSVDGPGSATVRRHLAQLSWHAVRLGEGLAFPGNQLLRLSMDLATGSAGILLAMQQATHPVGVLGGLLGDSRTRPHTSEPVLERG